MTTSIEFMKPQEPTLEDMKDFSAYTHKLYQQGCWRTGITLVSFFEFHCKLLIECYKKSFFLFAL